VDVEGVVVSIPSMVLRRERREEPMPMLLDTPPLLEVERDVAEWWGDLPGGPDDIINKN